MKKLFTLICAGMIMAMVLSGCGAAETSQDDNIPEQTSEAVTTEEETEAEDVFTYDDARQVYMDAAGIWLPDATDVEAMYGGSPDGRYYALQFYGEGIEKLFTDSKELFVKELGVQTGEIDNHVRWTFPKDDGGSISYFLIYETGDFPMLTVVYQDSDDSAEQMNGLDGGVIN